MLIYLIRHATAEAAGEGGDATRRLTERGLREAEEAGRALRKRDVSVGRVLSSPLMRARETAERIASSFEPPLPVDIRPGLTSGASPQDYLDVVRGSEFPAIALVGHMPDLGVFLGVLTGQSLSFRPASIIGVDSSPTPARIAWIRHPDA